MHAPDTPENIWFDKHEIKPGDDWRRAIMDGIDGSNQVLSFLSKHSTRDPGVCLDEIAIAIGVKGGNIQTVLVESEPEVKPPASISHIQWLDMHDWKERKERGSGIPPNTVSLTRLRVEDGSGQNARATCGAGILPATILSENDPATPGLPVSGAPPEHPDSWESRYQEKFAEIVRVVESVESQRFAGEIETLNGLLKPISSDSRISLLLGKGFVGREWLFKAVENWRTGSPSSDGSSEFNLHPSTSNHSSPSRLFWITGDPGVGKSAFAAHLTHFGRDKVIAAQFVEWDKPDHRDAARVIRSLAFQLATRLPDYRKRLLTLPEIARLDRKNPAELFDYLLTTPLQGVIDGGRERYLIVIDALDEASENGRNPLVEMLARHAPRLPEWLGIVVTSRPESAVTEPFQGLNPLVLDTQTEATRDDLRLYLSRALAPQIAGRADADRIVERILEKSEGVFLYAEQVCAALAPGGNLTLDHLFTTVIRQMKRELPLERPLNESESRRALKDSRSTTENPWYASVIYGSEFKKRNRITDNTQ